MSRMRTAIYFTPAPDHALTLAAARWLGRNVHGDPVIDGPRLDGLAPREWVDLTAAPRRYGFHATLKAPFAIAPQRSISSLDNALQVWCAETGPLDLPALEIRRIGAFFALVPAVPSADLQKFAGDVVRDFDVFRAPLTEAEYARRVAAGLSADEVENVRNWGYPYVFDAFRFHMTLTGPVPEDRRDAVAELLHGQFRPFLGASLTLDALTLCLEPSSGADFTVFSRHLLRDP